MTAKPTADPYPCSRPATCLRHQLTSLTSHAHSSVRHLCPHVSFLDASNRALRDEQLTAEIERVVGDRKLGRGISGIRKRARGLRPASPGDDDAGA